MVRSVVSKVMWVGRATVFMVGLAVILALLFGAVSTVSAHTGERGFFHLGHRNVESAVSKLVGKVAGPSLFIGNGSENRRATALRLKVKPGKAPVKVNAAAGKATNLNADKLDGKDSSEIGINGYQRVRSESSFNSTAHKGANAFCPAGKHVIGGGASVFPSLSDPARDSAPIVIRHNGPAAVGESWSVLADEISAYGPNWEVSAMAICAN